MKKEIVDDNESFNIGKKIKTLTKEDRFFNEPIKDMKKDFPNEIEKIEEALNKYAPANDFKILKTEFPDQ